MLTSSAAFAQKSRPRSTGAKSKVATKSQPKPEPKAEAKPAPVRTGKIDLEAGLVFNSGDVKPVVRADFYLFKDNAEKIVITQKHLDLYNQEIVPRGTTETLNGWSMYGAVLYMNGRLTPSFAVAVKKSLESSSVASSTTGLDGKATLEDVPVGDYYLFGYYKFGRETAYWNIPVSVKPGTNKIILSNDNMN
jgi:uncharacterized protein YdeI (BOF family)